MKLGCDVRNLPMGWRNKETCREQDTGDLTWEEHSGHLDSLCGPFTWGKCVKRTRKIQVEAEGEADPIHPGLSGAVRAQEVWALLQAAPGILAGCEDGGAEGSEAAAPRECVLGVLRVGCAVGRGAAFPRKGWCHPRREGRGCSALLCTPSSALLHSPPSVPPLPPLLPP